MNSVATIVSNFATLKLYTDNLVISGQRTCPRWLAEEQLLHQTRSFIFEIWMFLINENQEYSEVKLWENPYLSFVIVSIIANG